MMHYPEADLINELLKKPSKIVVLQADNPDGDSLGSSLALEHILSDLGHEVSMYCGISVPSYLHYIDGWDRVVNEIPTQFDMSIIVDVSADSLFDTLNKGVARNWIASKPSIIIDHHIGESTIEYATIVCNRPAVATAEVIYELALQLNWPVNIEAKKALLSSILSDSLGLTSEGTTARSIEIVSELVEGGAKISELENKRRELMRKSPELVHYKGKLLERVEYFNNDQIATVTIPWQEIEKYSHEYNPSVLVLDDMRQTTNTKIAIAFKTYNDGRVTAKIRCNYGSNIAKDLAEHFGGGGHPYASGFRVNDNKNFEDLKKECIDYTSALLLKK